MMSPKITCPLLMVAIGFAHAASAADAESREPQKAYQGAFRSEVSYTGDSRLSMGSTRLGELNSTRTAAGYIGTFRLTDDWSASAGVDWDRLSLSKPTGAAIPSTLQSVALPIGATWKINDDWSLRAAVAPGIYSDFDDISSRDFNAPFNVSVSYSVNRDLQLFGFLGVNTWSSEPVIGGVGARWKFAPDWTLLVAVPQTRLQYELNEKTSLYLGASFLGGAYRVSNTFGQANGRADLDGAKVTYRQINAILGVDYQIDKALEFSLNGGWAFNRRFEYHDQRLTIRSSGAPYVSAGLNFKY